MASAAAQVQRIERLETSMRKVANVLRQLGGEMRSRGADGGVATLLVETANEIEAELDAN
ncbi:MAG: hypothetical protein OXF79_22075 [Chloroflexi bacterium]|nr:hypothetical protein [Chloroflexota bacterium]